MHSAHAPRHAAVKVPPLPRPTLEHARYTTTPPPPPFFPTGGNDHYCACPGRLTPATTNAAGAFFPWFFFSSFRPKSPNPYYPPTAISPSLLYTSPFRHSYRRHTNALRCCWCCCRFHFPLVLISRNILKAPSALGRVGDTHTRSQPALLLLRSPIVITVVIVVVVIV